MEGVLPPLNEDMIGRHFANAIMHWKITNISLAFCTPSMLIHSPEFSLSGPVETRWKMTLDISAQADRIVLYLEMLPSKVRNLRVKVNWIAYVLDPREGNVAVAVERAHTFEPGCRLTVDAFELWTVIRKLPDASPDVLRIRCSMLVQFGYNPPFPKASYDGIVGLSYDLSRLPKENLYSDLTVQAKDTRFPLHRGMLFQRSEKFAQIIKPYFEHQTVKLYLSDHNALDSLFAYLYTGDLSFILSNPTIMICDYIERLGIPELKNLYPLEKIRMESLIEANEYVFGWTVVDFESIKEPLSGSRLKQEGMESCWKLHLYPKGQQGANEQQKKFFYVEAELLESTKPVDACIEFSSLDETGGIIHSRRIHGKMNAHDRVGLDFFRIGGVNMNKCLIDNTLFLRFTVRIATGGTFNLLKESHPPAPLTLTNEATYRIFSQMMGSLLANKFYSDVGLIVDGDIFKAHKFLLAARSPTFKRLLENSSRHSFNATLTIPNVRRHVFRVFLEFLYTGVLNDADTPVVIQLYDVTSSFSVDYLKRICAKLLEDQVTPITVFKYLMWADDRKETDVKTQALQVIANSFDTDNIHCHPDWPLLVQSKPDLCNDIMVFLTQNSSN